ncbi:PrsW family intramembrane metalloprotease [Streptomyces sp. TS71-3]|uniref:PrsW family intramembrane metalloprotease n=1 Tax=Streptomyces sp. TS71-3 TaxID=2733862 RepID=UPI002018060D|nr:PrsW family intramembrane metalloprotease [Streptomyces sp. TS71-3]
MAVPATAVPASRHPHWWQRRSVQAGAVTTLLALSGLVILALVREQTGTQGFLVGLGLAVLPVPLLVAAFRWLDRVAPGPWRNLVFCFAWGACAAALIAIVANSFATHWIAAATADPSSADTLGATVIAPFVEESSKAAAVLLLFLFRRRDLTGLVDGVVVAGVTATGFAFTENILYLGTAFGDDQLSGDSGFASMTVATFFVRVVMSPFAHPLFTVLSGIGIGLAAGSGEGRRIRKVVLSLAGLLLAMGMHAMWNASSDFGDYGFLLVYVALMVPAFAGLTWLVVWSRQRELHTVRTELPVYVAAGWLPPHEPFVLGSMRARRSARQYAGQALGGKDAARVVADYEAYATSLAFLRHRGRRGRAGGDFAAREEALLQELWGRREVARPALAYATRELPASVWFTPHWSPGPYGPPLHTPYGYAPLPATPHGHRAPGGPGLPPGGPGPIHGPGPAHGPGPVQGPGLPYGHGPALPHGSGALHGAPYALPAMPHSPPQGQGQGQGQNPGPGTAFGPAGRPGHSGGVGSGHPGAE